MGSVAATVLVVPFILLLLLTVDAHAVDFLLLLIPLAFVMRFHVSAITDIAICAELFMIRLLSLLFIFLRLFSLY